MNQDEKSAIDGLFGRLRQAEDQSGPRDAEAEAQIREALARQPAAPYYLAQAVLVQEQLLKNLNDRVRQLEDELTRRPAAGGGFLSGLFGGGGQAATAGGRPAVPPPPPASHGPLQPRSGGFLGGGALQTVAAVAGGVLLGNLVADMFAGEEAQAAPVAEPPAEPETLEAPEEDRFGGFDAGGDEDEFL